MRRLIGRAAISVLAGAVLFIPDGCKRQEKVPLQLTEEESPPLASTLHVADPRASSQLLNGFHTVEQNAWRWTMQKFAVSLRLPGGAAEKGATLQLNLTIPETLIQKLKTITLTAAADGVSLKEETYTKAGNYVYSRDVPKKVLSQEAVRVDFALDKSFVPGQVERRQLGVVVTTVGFELK